MGDSPEAATDQVYTIEGKAHAMKHDFGCFDAIPENRRVSMTKKKFYIILVLYQKSVQISPTQHASRDVVNATGLGVAHNFLPKPQKRLPS